MSDQPRRRVNIFLIFAIALFVIALFAAKGHDLLAFGWNSWMIAGFISVCLMWLFPNAVV
jgi:hypothetical protein